MRGLETVLYAKEYVERSAIAGREAYGVWFNIRWKGRNVMVLKEGCESVSQIEEELCELMGELNGKFIVTEAAMTYVASRNLQVIEAKSRRGHERVYRATLARRPNGEVAAVSKWRYNKRRADVSHCIQLLFT